MVGSAHYDVVGIRFAADVFTSSTCWVLKLLPSRKEQNRLVHWNASNIRVHVRKGGAVELDASQNAGLLMCGQCCCRSARRVAITKGIPDSKNSDGGNASPVWNSPFPLRTQEVQEWKYWLCKTQSSRM